MQSRYLASAQQLLQDTVLGYLKYSKEKIEVRSYKELQTHLSTVSNYKSSQGMMELALHENLQSFVTGLHLKPCIGAAVRLSEDISILKGKFLPSA